MITRNFHTLSFINYLCFYIFILYIFFKYCRWVLLCSLNVRKGLATSTWSFLDAFFTENDYSVKRNKRQHLCIHTYYRVFTYRSNFFFQMTSRNVLPHFYSFLYTDSLCIYIHYLLLKKYFLCIRSSYFEPTVLYLKVFLLW